VIWGSAVTEGLIDPRWRAGAQLACWAWPKRPIHLDITSPTLPHYSHLLFPSKQDWKRGHLCTGRTRKLVPSLLSSQLMRQSSLPFYSSETPPLLPGRFHTAPPQKQKQDTECLLAIIASFLLKTESKAHGSLTKGVSTPCCTLVMMVVP
jgi:hypothetical protein